MPNVFSLFTGAGGLDLGFEAAGFDVVAVSDIMPESCETLRINRPGIKVLGPPTHSGDIADITAEFIENQTGLKPGEVDVMIGGPPCQTFSVAAAQRFLKSDDKFKRRGFDSDRGSLVFQYLRLIQEVKPKVFVIENVPGFATIDGGKTIENIKNVLSEIGYSVTGPHLVHTEEYGVPQARRRVIVVGYLGNEPFNFPEPTHGKGINIFTTKEFVTTAQALVAIDSKSKNQETRSHKQESIDRYKTLSFGKREKLGRVDRLDPNKPSKTIIAGGSNGGGRSHLHPFESRTLSVRESAKLQTFPDDFVFYGKIGRQFTQVGNAVPPLLGEIIARQIGEQYFGLRYKNKKLKFAIPEIDSEKAVQILRKKSHKTHSDLLYDDELDDNVLSSGKIEPDNGSSFKLDTLPEAA
jgi:DNA (cytosine-5)-methyltransferase 1